MQFEETEQASQPDPDRAGMVESSGHDSKNTMINMLRGLLEKAANIQDQMSNVSREMEFLGKDQNEVEEIKTTNK